MADFDSHPAGTFCWPELSTTDQKAGSAFYRALFDWTANDQDMGPGGVYTLFQMRGRDVAAGAGQQPAEREHGVPPHWNTYVSVADADATVKRAQELGGKVLAPAFDVMEHGRMAVLSDPVGAVFCVWQPKSHIGARILREPGALTWTELSTTDPEGAKKFYTALFGWTEKTSTGAGMTYTEIMVNGTPQGGIMEMNAQMKAMNVPPSWLPYFQVADCDKTAEKATTLGAKMFVPPMDIPGAGRFAVVQDPQGAVFAIYRQPAR